MRTLTKLLAGSALAAGLAFAASANANVVTIEIKYDGVLYNLATPGDTYVQGANFAQFFGAIGAFNLNLLGGSINDVPLLQTNANVQGTDTASHRLDVYVTGQGYTTPSGPTAGFISTFQSSVLSPGWTIDETTWISPTNKTPLGGSYDGSTLATAHMDPSLIAGTTATTGFNPGTGPYSITAQYTIISGFGAQGNGAANSVVNVLNAVPEPATWALMIMGFGGVGAMARSRRRQASFA
jgi:hypothetical protein